MSLDLHTKHVRVSAVVRIPALRAWGRVLTWCCCAALVLTQPGPVSPWVESPLYPSYTNRTHASRQNRMCCICTTKNVCVSECLPKIYYLRFWRLQVFWKQKKSIPLCAGKEMQTRNLIETPWGQMPAYSVNLWMFKRPHCKQNMTVSSRH